MSRRKPRKNPTLAPAIPEIANFIREARNAKGLSQQQIAEKLGYGSAQYISDWERARSGIPLERLLALAEILQVDANELFELFLEYSIQKLTRETRDEYDALVIRKSARRRVKKT